jgi:hypothetical protein
MSRMRALRNVVPAAIAAFIADCGGAVTRPQVTEEEARELQQSVYRIDRGIEDFNQTYGGGR